MINTRKFDPNKRFMDPLSDFGFKQLFGTEEHKEFLIRFLHEVLPEEGIEDVTFLPTDKLIAIGPLKEISFDVYCTCSNGNNIIIEMQNAVDSYTFRDRMLVYGSVGVLDNYVKRAEKLKKLKKESKIDYKSLKQYDINKVIVCAVTAQNVFPETKRAAIRCGLCDLDEPQVKLINDKLLHIYIEMAKLADGTGEDDSTLSYSPFLREWAHFMTSDLDEIHESASEPFLQKFVDACDTWGFSSELRQKYIEYMGKFEYEMNILETYADGLRKGYEDGEAKGEAKGLAEGEAKGKAEVIKAMLAAGVSAEVISNALGVSVEELKR